jgi:sugar phosphate isomerase/epimerase
MSRLFSLAYLTIPGVTPPEQVRIAAEAGYDAISPRLIQMGVPGEPDIDPCAPKVVAETRAALAGTGLVCHDIELARVLRGTSADAYERAFAAGAELGARHVISSAWTDVRNDLPFIVDRFCEICDLAERYGLTVNLEYPAFSRLCCIEDAIGVLRRARRENQGLLIDTLYHHFTGGQPEDLLLVPREWVHFLHVCDTSYVAYEKAAMIHIARDARMYPGEGTIAFDLFATAFPDAAISLELPNAARTAELGRTEHARRALVGAQRFFGPGLRAAA